MSIYFMKQTYPERRFLTHHQQVMSLVPLRFGSNESVLRNKDIYTGISDYAKRTTLVLVFRYYGEEYEVFAAFI